MSRDRCRGRVRDVVFADGALDQITSKLALDSRGQWREKKTQTTFRCLINHGSTSSKKEGIHQWIKKKRGSSSGAYLGERGDHRAKLAHDLQSQNRTNKSHTPTGT